MPISNLVRFVTRRSNAASPKRDVHAFTCNICGSENQCPRAQFSREAPSCLSCRSTVRMRSIIHALSVQLFGKGMAIDQIPVRKDLRGVGMSDWKTYAQRLQQKFSYTNTFYDHEPKLDILNPPAEMLDTLDFIISTDVFEHVAPPVQSAFNNAAALLKSGGHFIFSVPFTLDTNTVEHFPELHEYRIDRTGVKPRLINKTQDGREQVFDNLCFHGGEGATLEMRVFCRDALVQHLKDADFNDICICDQESPQWGVLLNENWSLVITATKRA